ncbi:MAG: hypothetical protein NTW19_12060 [Planctomycetota bacterium]|nr:hypothetical protein [Planctomycetota bacterium]
MPSTESIASIATHERSKRQRASGSMSRAAAWDAPLAWLARWPVTMSMPEHSDRRSIRISVTHCTAGVALIDLPGSINCSGAAKAGVDGAATRATSTNRNPWTNDRRRVGFIGEGLITSGD